MLAKSRRLRGELQGLLAKAPPLPVRVVAGLLEVLQRYEQSTPPNAASEREFQFLALLAIKELDRPEPKPVEIKVLIGKLERLLEERM
jgi:hypothetical protein